MFRLKCCPGCETAACIIPLRFTGVHITAHLYASSAVTSTVPQRIWRRERKEYQLLLLNCRLCIDWTGAYLAVGVTGEDADMA